MTQGIKKLRKILMGRETTAGTNVAATTIWRGMGTIEDKLEVVFIEEDIGYLSGVNRTAIPKVEAALELEEVDATFEQFKHICEMGVMTTTATTDGGAGTGKVYTYTAPTTTVRTVASIKTYSIEGGDNAQAEEASYFFCEKFSLSGAARETLKMSANLIGRQVATTTFTTTATLPSVETILFSKGTIAIDTAGGTMGSTVKSNTLLEAALDWTTGIVQVYTGDGQLYFSFVKDVGPEITLDITFEHETSSIAEIAAWRAETPRLLELKWVGSAFSTAGTTYTYKTLKVSLAGKWEKFEKIGDKDGNDVVKGTFRAGYDTTASKFAVIVVVDNEATIP
jgi:hypothetical protein